MLDYIKIRGARQHNLKNIDLDIPKNKFVVITGVSGSGKSSLAFDTIYAEGQRRYVESLSAYARQFLGIMDKPDVDLIEGLSPSISIDQKTVSHNPRSTVGTITEIYDYLRVLFARIGHPHCPNCGIEISRLSVDEIADKIGKEIKKQASTDKIKPHRFSLLSPVVRQRKGEFRDLFDNIRSKGFSKLRVDNKLFNISDEIDLIKTNKHSIDVVIDELAVQNKELQSSSYDSRLRSRLSNDIEQATNLSDGLVLLVYKTDTVNPERQKKTGSIEFTELLYSEKFSCPNCNLSLAEVEPRMFSFNSPLGACEKCRGIGTIFRVEPDLTLNKNLTINEGGITPFSKFFFAETWYIRLVKQVCEEEGIDLDKPIGKLSRRSLDMLLFGTDKTYRVEGKNRFGRDTAIYEKFEGIVGELEKRYFSNQGDFAAAEIQKYMREEVCPSCKGNKLKPEILSITIDEKNIAGITNLSIDRLLSYYEQHIEAKLNPYEKQISMPILKEIITRMKFLQNVGLSYLTISRTARTLSGGELQRIRLASQIGTGLTGVLYVLDEPSIGLHPKDVSALIKTLHELKNIGNTILVVEHDRETIESAEHILELGPYAGKHGGTVTFNGTLKKMLSSAKSLTGHYLSGRKKIRSADRSLQVNMGKIILKGASEFNLKKINVSFPLGNMIAVTGVSGSGKSTLVVETLYPALKYYLDGYYHDKIGEFDKLEGFQYIERAYLVDQSPIGRTPRSNPATYVGFFDDVRELFATTVDAKMRGFKKGRFSFNLKGGRCEKCQGAGVIKIEMQFLSDVFVTCDVCNGRRYNKETLEVKFKDKNIYEILKMTVDEAVEFFKNHFHIHQKLIFLKNVGLGYIEIGQPAPTFSGGEAQRIKLANELSKRETGNILYILDEPTTGLHFYDIEKLLHTLQELVRRGNTVIVIEHNLDVIKNCQYIVDLGPEGGEKGGYSLYQGEIQGILKEKNSYTGQYLKKVL
ncbi:excinuclease ABC subunit A [Candidatus Roizmanbacteria bacterium RIFCSPHIGHO2_01_FULL_39_8]|uniref:UvrABC system protein A n=2 Tax=Candidatus Roizmaniibacteriota TaxID=1752723 RepID=A0A1F7GU30_9BACT|nr:MAG: excinuclease ABC subunit A [Candidatus Roizmanbacteria bacterium RIFCSPHIGHO2_01_FULL_39_8]OGK28188.1 MAG: excinuclease ABC subunit A [Candidatus Roizmanbacteria bacterium RIFCSPHIGHO2_02_FULL_39_9]